MACDGGTALFAALLLCAFARCDGSSIIFAAQLSCAIHQTGNSINTYTKRVFADLTDQIMIYQFGVHQLALMLRVLNCLVFAKRVTYRVVICNSRLVNLPVWSLTMLYAAKWSDPARAISAL